MYIYLYMLLALVKNWETSQMPTNRLNKLYPYKETLCSY